MIGEAYLFFLSTEFRANQTKIRLPQLGYNSVTCTNLNFIPNQLEENLTTSKVYLESFLLNTTSSKDRTQCFLSDLRIALILNNQTLNFTG